MATMWHCENISTIISLAMTNVGIMRSKASQCYNDNQLAQDRPHLHQNEEEKNQYDDQRQCSIVASFALL
jgi:hypothetical protein